MAGVDFPKKNIVRNDKQLVWFYEKWFDDDARFSDGEYISFCFWNIFSVQGNERSFLKLQILKKKQPFFYLYIKKNDISDLIS